MAMILSPFTDFVMMFVRGNIRKYHILFYFISFVIVIAILLLIIFLFTSVSIFVVVVVVDSCLHFPN